MFRLILWPFRVLYRAYVRLELEHIKDLRADELDRQRKHDATIRMLDAEAAELRWKLGGRPSQSYGLQALRQRKGGA